jgi:DNA-binding NarL/FixJ family response regulator
MTAKNKLNVLIADPQLLARLGLRQVLEAHPQVGAIAEAGSESELWEVVGCTPVDLIVLDYDHPGLISVETLSRIRSKLPEVGVLVISAAQQPDLIYRVLELNVHGFLTKTCDEQEIHDAVRAASRREKFYCTKILDHLLERTFSGPGLPLPDENCSPLPLTPRETDILRLVAQGFIAKEIAEILNLSTHTIYTHRKNILKKLNIHSSSELLLYALNNGLVESDFNKKAMP